MSTWFFAAIFAGAALGGGGWGLIGRSVRLPLAVTAATAPPATTIALLGALGTLESMHWIPTLVYDASPVGALLSMAGPVFLVAAIPSLLVAAVVHGKRAR